MLQFITKKIRSQRLLNGCLFLGIMILVAVLSLIPMFEKGALDDVILYNFEDKALETNQYPAVINAHSIKGRHKVLYGKHLYSIFFNSGCPKG